MKREISELLAKLDKEYKKALAKARILNDNMKDAYLDALRMLSGFVSANGGEFIGEGSCRKVFKIGNYALKIASTKAGLAQNQLECKIEPSKFLNKIHCHDKHNLPSWVLTDYCKPATKYHIRKTLKVTPKTFDSMVTAKRFNTIVNRNYLKKMSKYNIATQYINFMAKYDLLGGDIMSHRLDNYGVNPQGKLVLLDYGLDGKVWDKYY
jgi:hypothetical protein